ncbi:MAG TPA: hypothetical protein VMV70_00230 [Gallionella sp.]|nr:hypothetical protein [Gallionella sp.]
MEEQIFFYFSDRFLPQSSPSNVSTSMTAECRLCEFANVRNRAAHFFSHTGIFIALKLTFANRHYRHVAAIQNSKIWTINVQGCGVLVSEEWVNARKVVPPGLRIDVWLIGPFLHLDDGF